MKELAQIIFENGDRYEGGVFTNKSGTKKPSGWGTVYFENGDIFEGVFDPRLGGTRYGIYKPKDGESRYVYFNLVRPVITIEEIQGEIKEIDNMLRNQGVEERIVDLPEIRARFFISGTFHHGSKDEFLRDIKFLGEEYERNHSSVYWMGVLVFDLGYVFAGEFQYGRIRYCQIHVNNQGGFFNLDKDVMRANPGIFYLREIARGYHGGKPEVIDPRQLLGISVPEPSDGSDFSLRIGRVHIDESFVASRLEDDRATLRERIKVFARQTKLVIAADTGDWQAQEAEEVRALQHGQRRKKRARRKNKTSLSTSAKADLTDQQKRIRLAGEGYCF